MDVKEDVKEDLKEDMKEDVKEDRKEDGAPQAQEPKQYGKFALGLQKYCGWLFLFFTSYVMIFAGQVLGSVLISVIHGVMKGKKIPFADSDLWLTMTMYLIFIGMWVVVLIVMFCRKNGRPVLDTLWTKLPGNNWKGFLIGMLIGGGANAFCALIAWLHQDIKLYYESFQPLPLLLILVAVFIQSSAEELVCRGYLYQRLMKLYHGNFWLCAILNSLLFALLHLQNEGVTVLSLVNIFLSGIMFTLMVYYFDSMWAAFAGHMAWNYTQNIIFGLPNSGMVVPFSIFKLDASTAMDSFAYNVGFGIEGTVVADIVLFLCCVGIWLWGSRRKKR